MTLRSPAPVSSERGEADREVPPGQRQPDRAIWFRVFSAAVLVFGLWIYVWPAFFAPVVRWSDSDIDLRWAAEGIGLWKALPANELSAPHPLKVGYLLFLRYAPKALPFVARDRAIVIVQSISLWCAILFAAFRAMKAGGRRAGGVTYAVLICYLPLRDASSAIMSEALAATLALFIAGILIRPPSRGALPILAALLIGLFWVRPNVGGVVLAVSAATFLAERRYRPLAALMVLFGGAFFGTWLITRPFAGSDARRDVGAPLLWGSMTYLWSPTVDPWPRAPLPGHPDPRLRRSADNWRLFLESNPADRNRELVWRGLHGLFGIDYYDATWSRGYSWIEAVSRTSLPAALVVVLALAIGCRASAWRAAIWPCLVVAGIVLQSLLFGAIPRLAIPLVPLLLLRATIRPARGSRSVRLGVATAGLAILLTHPEIASWDWGKVEASGITLVQRVHRGSLPKDGPAVLHVRIGSLIPAAPVDLALSLGGRLLLPVGSVRAREQPFVSAQIPNELLALNRVRDLELRVTSVGSFARWSYLLFPVVPWPWGSGAHRLGSAALSPATDIRAGALDWWSHAGLDRDPRKLATASRP